MISLHTKAGLSAVERFFIAICEGTPCVLYNRPQSLNLVDVVRRIM